MSWTQKEVNHKKQEPDKEITSSQLEKEGHVQDERTSLMGPVFKKNPEDPLRKKESTLGLRLQFTK